jgi:hypothetical protein
MVQGVGGVWSGWYDYSPGHGRTAFSCTLDERGGVVTGSTLEDGPTGELCGLIEGSVSVGYLSFVKRYVGAPPGYDHPILYSGEINAACTQVSGQWVIEVRGPGLFGARLRVDGAFAMRRVSQALSLSRERTVVMKAG